MEKQKNIPKLRFPEFKGEWEKKKLGDIFKISAGGDIGFENVSETKTDKFQYPIYANAEKNKGFYGYSDIYKIEGGVVTVAGRGVNLGIAHARDHKFYPIVRLLVLKPKKTENIYFFEYQINQLNIFKESTGVPQLTAPQVSGYEIYYPTIPEQIRIASFFTVLDKKIAELKQKKTLLEQYKKGVMQKLFCLNRDLPDSQDDHDFEKQDEKSGQSQKSQKSRFRQENGKEFPEWEKKKLGEVFTFKTTNSFSRENLNYEVGIAKNIHYGDIHTKFQTLFDVTKETVPFINSEISIQKIANDNYCREGDLILADASEDLNDVGKSIELVNLNKERLLSGLHTILARPIYGVFASGFCGHLFKSDFVRVQIQKESQGSKVLSISASRLSNVILSFPCIEEQTKIANFLSAIDEKINRTENQIQKTQEWKKGLLQQMFV